MIYQEFLKQWCQGAALTYPFGHEEISVLPMTQRLASLLSKQSTDIVQLSRQIHRDTKENAVLYYMQLIGNIDGISFEKERNGNFIIHHICMKGERL